MRLCIFTEPQQGATYADLRAVAIRTEECGFDGFFRSDHFLHMGSRDGLPGPTDAWITLAALAVETSRVRLGTLVSPATFRSPGPLSIMVAQVDAMSGGRVELGLGAGWYEREHEAYGLPFPDARTRFDMLEEQLTILRGLWATPEGEKFSFAGEYYTLVDSPARPKPVQPGGPTVIVGGSGARRTPDLAARFADEFNAFESVAEAKRQFDRVRSVAADVRSDERGPLGLSATATVCTGRTDAEVAERAARSLGNVDRVKAEGLYGTVNQIADGIHAYREAGADRVFLQLPDLYDLDHIDAIAEVLPLVG